MSQRLDTAQKLKWVSTVFILSGIALTSFNIYPLNLVVHCIGCMGWAMVGFMSADKAMMTNFGVQIPIFAMGGIHYLIGL